VSLDSADTVSVGKTNSDVSLVTPARTPRVLDDVMVSTVSNSENSVVENVTAAGGDDSIGVVSKHLLVSLDGDSNGTGVQGSLEVSNTNRHREVAGGIGNTLGFVGSATLVVGFVRVVSLKDDSVLLSVVESVILPATIATVVEVDTVNILLLGEGEESGVLNLEVSLKSTSGREGPAGSALTLILDRGDSTSFSPVNGVGNSDRGDTSGLLLGLLVTHVLPSLHALELFGGHCGDLVVTEGVSVHGVGVPLVDFLIGLGEQLFS